MTDKSSTTKHTVDKLAKNKKARQTDGESKNIQRLGRDMSAPNDQPVKKRGADN